MSHEGDGVRTLPPAPPCGCKPLQSKHYIADNRVSEVQILHTMDFELFSTQEAFDLASSQAAEADVEGALSLDPFAATAIATAVVASLLLAVQLTRHFTVAINVQVPEINTKSLNISSFSKNIKLSRSAPKFPNIQVKSVVRGHVN